MFTQLDSLLGRKHQRFICTDTGWPEPGPVRHEALLEHDVGPPLDPASLAQLGQQVGDLPELLAFYARYGSLRLFRDTVASDGIGCASAFHLAAPDAWPELRDGLEGWFDSLDPDEREELLPEWLDHVVVFGEVPNAGNYFLMPLAGAERGKVYEFEHDGFEFIERGAGMADFVRSISVVTDDLLKTIRGHTRYCDGKTATQWLCREYRFDAEV